MTMSYIFALGFLLLLFLTLKEEKKILLQKEEKITQVSWERENPYLLENSKPLGG